jgi:hypothetical protein
MSLVLAVVDPVLARHLEFAREGTPTAHLHALPAERLQDPASRCPALMAHPRVV